MICKAMASEFSRHGSLQQGPPQQPVGAEMRRLSTGPLRLRKERSYCHRVGWPARTQKAASVLLEEVPSFAASPCWVAWSQLAEAEQRGLLQRSTPLTA
mmetsp:Transcript_30011/g.69880  ORF Transcript_30011/g.69880 Transcript_30011/m.69880 type:complete len:99 (+) Transcript_30011:64-360(+)